MTIDKEKTLKTAEKYIQAGKLPAAIEEYRKLAFADPRDLTVVNTLGDLCVRAGRTEEATMNFLRVAEGYIDLRETVRAIAMYKKILKFDPTNTDVALKLGDLYFKQKLVVEARQQYSAVAESFRRNGQGRQALQVLERALGLDPTNAVLRMELAADYHQEGYLERAFEAYLEAGHGFFSQGHATESIQAYQKALSLRPESVPAIKGLVKVLIHQGELKTALGMLDRLIKQNPTDQDLIVLLGRTYLNARLLDHAERTFVYLLQLSPEKFPYLIEVGHAFREAGQFDRAIVVFDRCRDIVLERGEKRALTGLLRTILKAEPNNLIALSRLADVYERVGEKRNLAATLNLIVNTAIQLDHKKEAGNALRKLIEIDPRKAVYREQLDTLDESVKPLVPNEPRQQFPEGFEAGPALAAWMRRADGSPPETTSTTSAPVEPAGPTTGEFSSRLLEQMLIDNPEIREARLKLLEEMVVQNPTHVEARIQLKQCYLDDGKTAKAAAQAVELARIYEAQGNLDHAMQARAEAFELDPNIGAVTTLGAGAHVGGPVDGVFDLSSALLPTGGTQTIAETDIEVMLSFLGIASRRQFDRYLDREWRRAARGGDAISLLVIGVDNLRTITETDGIAAAHTVMKRIAQALTDELKRPGDLLAFFEADHFAALLPETPADGAGVVAEKLRARVETLAIVQPNGGIITISIGLATAQPQPKAAADTLLSSVELALYQAQRGGGNRVVTGQIIG